MRDPRADVLKGAIERLGSNSTDLGFAAEVEAYARAALKKKNPERALDTNVEFFTAILLDALKIPRQAFTPVFAVGRVAGWTAHAREQQRRGRAAQAFVAVFGAATALKCLQFATVSNAFPVANSNRGAVAKENAHHLGTNILACGALTLTRDMESCGSSLTDPSCAARSFCPAGTRSLRLRRAQ